MAGKWKTIIWHELAKHNAIMKKIPSKIWYGVIARLFMRNAKVVARSVEARNFVKKYCMNTDVNVIDHGVNLDKFKASAEKDNSFVVCSQLIERKKIDGILEKFAKYLDRYNSTCRLYIIGEGELKEKLQRMAQTFGWIGSILYILIYVRIFFSFKWMNLNSEQKALLYAGYMQYIIHAVVGYFVANCLSFASTDLYLLIKLKIWKVISWKPENRSLKKEMVAYSVPMGLGNIGWWINNVSDRYIVTWICGLAANGVYSVAYKIPSLLSMFQQIFNQAWTISAVKEYDQDSSEFYSTIYKAYNMCMVITCAGLILFDKVIAKILFGADFYEAWKYAPFLMISVVFGALVQLLGGIFSAAKESKAFGNTILIGAAANTVMNVAFVYACGPLGAAIATSLSYMLIWVLRLYKVTRQMKLDISLIRDALSYVLLYLQATLLVFYSYNWSGYLIQIGFVVAVFVLYFKELTGVARKVLSRVKSR